MGLVSGVIEVTVVEWEGHARSPSMPIPKTAAQIVELIRDRIRTGVYRPGERLPTYPELAADPEIKSSTATVGRAIRELREAGDLVGVRGEGVWVAERTTDG
jgi:DNA-binding GntR family transcriptional regulator